MSMLPTPLFTVFIICAGFMLQPATAQSPRQGVIKTYADIARATYSDALTTAEALRDAVAKLIAEPNGRTLQAARNAWVAARLPYQQTEAYRFGNRIVEGGCVVQDFVKLVALQPVVEGQVECLPGLLEQVQ